MRSFLTAALLLSATVLLILLNSAAVIRDVDNLQALVKETARGSSPAAADELYAAWQSCRDFLSLSTHNSVMERAETALITALASRSDPVTQNAQLGIFSAALRHIAESQRFDFFNIF